MLAAMTAALGQAVAAADLSADTLACDTSPQRLHVGSGYIEPVPPVVWRCQVSGKQVLVQWLSDRKKNRERPGIGDCRKPSPPGDIQPAHWLPENIAELRKVLNMLGGLVDLEPAQAALLDRICAGALLPESALRARAAPVRQHGPRPGTPRQRCRHSCGV